MENTLSTGFSDLFSWLKTRQIELRQLIDIEAQQKNVLVPKLNQLNETLFLYRFEDLLLKNLEQLCLLDVYINSDTKIENYEFFSYVSGIITNVKDSLTALHLNSYPRQYDNYLNLSIYYYLKVVKF